MDMGLAARADRSESKIGRFDAALFRVETPESNMSTRSSAAVSLSCSDFRKAAEKYRRVAARSAAAIQIAAPQLGNPRRILC
jgi:hypothetical protein